MLIINYCPEKYGSTIVPDGFTQQKAEKIFYEFLSNPDCSVEYDFGTINMVNEFLLLYLKNEDIQDKIKFKENGADVFVDELGYWSIRNDRLRELVSQIGEIRSRKI